MRHNYKFTLGHVDLDLLNSDADFRSEAEKHVPAYIDGLSKFVSETLWNEFNRTAGPFKITTSKISFISEQVREFKRSVTAKDRRDYSDTIIQILRDMKAKQA
jgi:hypothetical protein